MGYTTKTLESNKWYLISSGFEAVGGNALSIQDFITGLTPGYEVYDAPNIQYWDGTELKTIIYADGVWSEEAGDFIVGWVDPMSGNIATIDAGAGFGCWIKLPYSGSITCAGQVVSADTKTKDISTTWELIGNPYPIALDINNKEQFDCSQLTPGYEVYDSPNIQYWDQTELKTLIYADGVWSEDAGDFIVGWVDPMSGNMMTEKFSACTGFWIRGITAGKIKFVK